MRALAESIAQEPGLVWKIWTESAAEHRAGGVYLFESRAAAEAYHRMHAERLGRVGVTGIEVTYRAVNAPQSRITRGPLP
ncbi:YdhR family protein [Dankookia sp. GCM10030260]|uniref:YdhR family protein n=1 Tax=Dankookia sp. GCM10030260 TaxID=3273390 RepID=UPI0036174ABE